MINYADVSQPTVLYIFSPACVWCNRNLENIKTLAHERGNSYRFIGLSLSDDKLKEFVEARQLNFPVYKNLSPESARLLGIEGTPQTIIVSHEGKVLKNWAGAFGPDLQPEVENFFDLHLPGVSQE
jgi:thioredoxin-related protein